MEQRTEALCKSHAGCCATRCISSLAGGVPTRPSQELARGVSVLRCSGWDVGKHDLTGVTKALKLFHLASEVYVCKYSRLGIDSILGVVTHADTAGSQEALAVIAAASCFISTWIENSKLAQDELSWCYPLGKAAYFLFEVQMGMENGSKDMSLMYSTLNHQENSALLFKWWLGTIMRSLQPKLCL